MASQLFDIHPSHESIQFRPNLPLSQPEMIVIMTRFSAFHFVQFTVKQVSLRLITVIICICLQNLMHMSSLRHPSFNYEKEVIIVVVEFTPFLL